MQGYYIDINTPAHYLEKEKQKVVCIAKIYLVEICITVSKILIIFLSISDMKVRHPLFFF